MRTEIQRRGRTGAASGNLAFPFVGRAEIFVLTEEIEFLADIRSQAGEKAQSYSDYRKVLEPFGQKEERKARWQR